MDSNTANDLSKSFQSLGIPKTHVTVGWSNFIATQKQYKSLFVNRRLPDYGWSDVQIQSLLFLFSTLDTNNKTLAKGGSSNNSDDDNDCDNVVDGDTRWCGVGEREGRVYSSLVLQRHFGLSHGMGRSGDITEPQPKAAGSSVLVKLTLLLTLDALKRGSGLEGRINKKQNGPAAFGILLPLCTGMSMSLLLQSMKKEGSPNKDIVLWSRIDQKSCFKAIGVAGLRCVVVPTKIQGDEVITDLEAMEAALQEHGDRVLAVITTTSCFAPRVPDSVDEVAKLCQKFNVYHVINNAYGLQCSKTSKLINRACVLGRVDAVVCSTDKNFLVPVGGAIIVSPNKAIIDNVGKVYAGRASSSPIVDLFITLLSMGLNGYKKLLNERMNMLKNFPSRLDTVAKKHGERLLICQSNTISFGITLDALARPQQDGETEDEYTKSVAKDISSFGAMLFSRCVSGTRVVPRAQTKVLSGEDFVGFGSSTDNYKHSYMTAACAIGVSKAEIDEFLVRLDKALGEYASKMGKTKAR
ncbi:pyridoxal-phosphate dependent enzyme [Nitzschia inconspicua]|uniref:O-phosphoseryl-tRNA(Sec) selenium transferase n=1 Tax=Nitzschia inconspicua TaxID=303405 RepID=A0A9K3PKJ4_9STRA|nr:pyridoxal-phosphate dependent enzyme [Nitzschia inconspicua]